MRIFKSSGIRPDPKADHSHLFVSVSQYTHKINQLNQSNTKIVLTVCLLSKRAVSVVIGVLVLLPNKLSNRIIKEVVT